LDLATRTWWPESLSWSGAAASLLAPLVSAGTALGTVSSPDLPQLDGAVLTVAGHDHQAAAVGVGAIEAGDELDSCGTAEAVLRTVAPGLATDDLLALTRAGVTIGWHALAEHWCLLGGTEGGLVLSRTLAALGIDRADLPALDAQALDVQALDVQALANEAGGALSSEVSGTGSAAIIWRQALEEVTGQAHRIHSAMSAVTGPHNRFVVTGGWAHSAGLLEIKRRAFGPVVHATVREAGALGAALLAGVAAEVYRDVDEAVHATKTSAELERT
jgi:sugar (pentulose or hexulose) kinase